MVYGVALFAEACSLSALPGGGICPEGSLCAKKQPKRADVLKG